MKKIEKVIKAFNKEYYLRQIEIIGMYPEARASQDELAKMIIEDQKELLKAVIEEIEERKKWLKENTTLPESFYEKILITEDDKIFNLIKESIKLTYE